MHSKLTLAVSVILMICTVTLADSAFRRVPDGPSQQSFSFLASPDPPVLPVVTRWQQKSRNSDEVVYSIDKEFSSSQTTAFALSTASPQRHYLATSTELSSQAGPMQVSRLKRGHLQYMYGTMVMKYVTQCGQVTQVAW